MSNVANHHVVTKIEQMKAIFGSRISEAEYQLIECMMDTASSLTLLDHVRASNRVMQDMKTEVA